MKQITYAIYEILRECSDENHPLTRHEILNLLEQRYDIHITRQTLKTHFDALMDIGIEVSSYEANRGYYLITREFEKSEIHLLCNAIFSSHFIPESDSNQLIDRFLKTQSKYNAKAFKNNVYVKNSRKTINKQFFLNIEMILEAIQKNRTISFTYMKYNHAKELVPRREKRYLIHPFHIVYANENFYLICMNDHYDDLSHYRIDKMQDIQIEEIPLKKLGKSFDPYEYSKTKIYMYGGTEERITLLCDDMILDDIIDRFGREVLIQKANNNQFEARIKSSRQGIIYFALQFSKYCKIIDPIDLKEEMISILENTLEKYKS